MATIQEHLEHQSELGRDVPTDPKAIADEFAETSADKFMAISRAVGSRVSTAASDVTSFAKANPWPVALGLVSLGAGILLASGAVSASSLVPKKAMDTLMPSKKKGAAGRNSATRKARKKSSR